MNFDNEYLLTASDGSRWVYDTDKRRWSMIENPPEDIIRKLRRFIKTADLFREAIKTAPSA